MASIGLFCQPETGHLNPTVALGAELARRGHAVSLYSVPDAAPAAARAGLGFVGLGHAHFPAGAADARERELATLSGVAAAVRSGYWTGRYAEAVLADAADRLAAHPVDLLLIDQIDVAAHTVAGHLGLPFVTIALCLIMNADEHQPVWSVEPTPDPPALTRNNRHWQVVFENLYRPQVDRLNAWRARHGRGPLAGLAALWSTAAQISQEPEGFDFPRRLPPGFHFAGPFSSRHARRQVDFPWERLGRRPLVYAAFGSLVNGDLERARAVARASADLDVQLVLSLGGAGRVEDVTGLAGDAIVVPYAPQLALLERASVMITHAGLNSVLECLSAGVPMVAVPITNDEFAIGARIAWNGTGLVVPADRCTPEALGAALATVLGDPRYREAARRFQAVIARRPGVERAADVVEGVLAREVPRVPQVPE
ncbi:MAG: glycosyltransferase [Vicinamibacterales bacterium]